MGLGGEPNGFSIDTLALGDEVLIVSRDMSLLEQQRLRWSRFKLILRHVGLGVDLIGVIPPNGLNELQPSMAVRML